MDTQNPASPSIPALGVENQGENSLSGMEPRPPSQPGTLEGLLGQHHFSTAIGWEPLPKVSLVMSPCMAGSNQPMTVLLNLAQITSPNPFVQLMVHRQSNKATALLASITPLLPPTPTTY